MKIVIIGGTGLIGSKLVPGDRPRLGSMTVDSWLNQQAAAGKK